MKTPAYATEGTLKTPFVTVEKRMEIVGKRPADIRNVISFARCGIKSALLLKITR